MAKAEDDWADFAASPGKQGPQGPSPSQEARQGQEHPVAENKGGFSDLAGCDQ
jgi:hypothetical protein